MADEIIRLDTDPAIASLKRFTRELDLTVKNVDKFFADINNNSGINKNAFSFEVGNFQAQFNELKKIEQQFNRVASGGGGNYTQLSQKIKQFRQVLQGTVNYQKRANSELAQQERQLAQEKKKQDLADKQALQTKELNYQAQQREVFYTTQLNGVLANNTTMIENNTQMRNLANTASSLQSSEYDKLIAKHQLLTRAIQEEVIINGKNSANVKAMQNELGGLTNQLVDIANATNNWAGKTEKGIPAAYSLQQILLETPNAALGARTYIMSLSNNLPMFVMQMQQAAKASGSFKSALALLKGAISPISILMVVLSTASILLVNNWDKIAAIFDKSAKSAKKLADDLLGLTGRIKDLNNADLNSISERQKGLADIIRIQQQYIEIKNNDLLTEQQRASAIQKLLKDTNSLRKQLGLSDIKTLKDYEEQANNTFATYRQQLNLSATSEQHLNNVVVGITRLSDFRDAISRLKEAGNEVENISLGMENFIRSIDLGFSSENLDKYMLSIENGKPTISEFFKENKLAAENFEKAVNAALFAINTDSSRMTIDNISYLKSLSGLSKEAYNIVSLLSKQQQQELKRELELWKNSNDTTRMAAILAGAYGNQIDRNTKLFEEQYQVLFNIDEETERATKALRDYILQMQSLSIGDNQLKQLEDYWRSIADAEQNSLQQRSIAYGQWQKTRLIQIRKANIDEFDEIKKSFADRLAEIEKNSLQNRKRAEQDIPEQVNIINKSFEEIEKVLNSKGSRGISSMMFGLDEADQIMLQNAIDMYLQRLNQFRTDQQAILDGFNRDGEQFRLRLAVSGIRKEIENLNREFQEAESQEELNKINRSIGDIENRFKGFNFLPFMRGFEETSITVRENRLELERLNEDIKLSTNEFNLLKEAQDKLAKSITLELGLEGQAGDAFTSKMTKTMSDYETGQINRIEYEKRIADAIQNTGKILSIQANASLNEYNSIGDEMISKAQEVGLKTTEMAKVSAQQFEKLLREWTSMYNRLESDTIDMAINSVSNALDHISEMIDINLENQIRLMDKEQEIADRRLENLKRQNEARIAVGQTDEELAEKSREYLIETMGLEDEAFLRELTNDEMLQMVESANEADREERELKKQQLEEEAARKQLEIDKAQATADYGIAMGELMMRVALMAAMAGSQTGIGAVVSVPAMLALGATLAAMLTANYGMKMSALNAKKFAEGGTVDSNMVAWVGDAFKHEYGVTKSGDIFRTPDKPTLTSLEGGTVIYKDLNTFLKEFINPRVNDEIMSYGETTYFGQFKEIGKHLKRIEHNTRSHNFSSKKYYTLA